jgi:hypothetical protein
VRRDLDEPYANAPTASTGLEKGGDTVTEMMGGESLISALARAYQTDSFILINTGVRSVLPTVLGGTPANKGVEEGALSGRHSHPNLPDADVLHVRPADEITRSRREMNEKNAQRAREHEAHKGESGGGETVTGVMGSKYKISTQPHANLILTPPRLLSTAAVQSYLPETPGFMKNSESTTTTSEGKREDIGHEEGAGMLSSKSSALASDR